MGMLPKMDELEAIDLADKSVRQAKCLLGLLCDGMGDGELDTSGIDADDLLETAHLLHDLMKDADRALVAMSEFRMARLESTRDRQLAG